MLNEEKQTLTSSSFFPKLESTITPIDFRSRSNSSVAIRCSSSLHSRQQPSVVLKKGKIQEFSIFKTAVNMSNKYNLRYIRKASPLDEALFNPSGNPIFSTKTCSRIQTTIENEMQINT